MKQKPLVIRLNEARESIFAHLQTVIREQEVPCYLLEPIVTDLLRQVKSIAQQEYQAALADKGGDEGES